MGVLNAQSASVLDTITNTTWYLGLFTTNPDAAGAGSIEVSGGAYGRQTLAAASWAAATAGDPSYITYDAAITFATATANWGNIVGWGLFTALTGGSPQYWGTITSQAVNSGVAASVASGQVKLESGIPTDTYS